MRVAECVGKIVQSADISDDKVVIEFTDGTRLALKAVRIDGVTTLLPFTSTPTTSIHREPSGPNATVNLK